MNNLGRAWEAQLQVWHKAYKTNNQAYVIHAPPPVKVLSVVKPDGSFQARWWKKGPCDFIGVVAGGRAVVFDAKHCASDRWPFKSLEVHQARALHAATQSGAFAFVALRMGRKALVLPWTAFATVYSDWANGKSQHGAASLTLQELRAIATPMDSSGWLHAVPQ